MIAVQTYKSSESLTHLRRFDAARDLIRVADLVEKCFADTLDADGRAYIRQMRSAANNPFYMRLASATGERVGGPLSGYVWEQDNQVVGNLTLIPYYPTSGRIYLVANVAVDLKYRRLGIARQLTSQAIEHARQNSAQAVWLHVRAENQAAITLYRSLGFIERSRRTTWIFERENVPLSELDIEKRGFTPRFVNPKIVRRRADDWLAEKAWLEAAYPKEITWHLPLNIKRLKPGFLHDLYRYFIDANIHQWSLKAERKLLGMLVINSSFSQADHLWLAAPSEFENEAAYHLLKYCQRKPHLHNSLTLDYPVGRAEQGIQAAGFHLHQTLIWMSLTLK
jgi:GNAT superfamily N-acetyltransferase